MRLSTARQPSVSIFVMPLSDCNLEVFINQQTENRPLLTDTLPPVANELRAEKGEPGGCLEFS